MEGSKATLIELAYYKMPFGKYKGEYLVDIPEYYYTWFKQKGFPEGKLGRMMTQMHDIKINGLEDIIQTIKRDFGKQAD
ncbi:DUF3820 family protein [Winogradskyella sp.]|uniref:DUF3820 family protein n=1 Tax=Winogradskyella sp. TaxID=1883156 RepID=UPI00262DD8FA|nr:DUF3820 family protein [Winogradskyella sp.]